jgi:hypothetical protein
MFLCSPASGSVNDQGGTLAFRIQFNGQDGQKVLCTSQDDIESLVPWLWATLSSLHLPHPRPKNIIKRNDATSVIEMFWDHAMDVYVRAHVLIHLSSLT